MIARQWIGETRESDADIYWKYLEETGMSEIRTTKGNKGVWLLRRLHEGKAEFVVISLWDSLEAIKSFAGHEYEKARYYAEDQPFLLRLDPHVTHYEVLVGSRAVRAEQAEAGLCRPIVSTR
jgi:heme-degrading monooxygenase HmoA